MALRRPEHRRDPIAAKVVGRFRATGASLRLWRPQIAGVALPIDDHADDQAPEWQLAGALAGDNVAEMAAGIRPLAMTSQHTLTRAEVAARLGISVSSVRRREFIDLHPVQDERGVWRFDPSELETAHPRPKQAAQPERRATSPEAYQGRQAARTFLLFARGASLRQIVVTTRQTPERVRLLYHEWMTSLEEGEWARARE